MAAPAPQLVAVRRLRVRDGRADAVAARLRTERALAAVELQPRGLPPAAILLVRSLRTTIADAPAALDELLRLAARPAREAVPARAPAVLFANRAELLACLAADWCSGVAPSRWWWTLVAPGADSRGPAGAWADTPESVPAAFARLAAWGRAVEFAARLDDDLAQQLAQAVARVHGVRAAGVDAGGRAAVVGGDAATDPAPEARAEQLTQSQRRLLRLALTLHRAPAALRVAAAEPPTAPLGRAGQPVHAPERARPASIPAPRPGTDAEPARAGSRDPAAQQRRPAGPGSRGMRRGEAPGAERVERGERAERELPIAPPLPAEPSLLEPRPPGRETPASPALELPPPIAPPDAPTDEPSAPGPLAFVTPSEPAESEPEPLAWRRPVETRLGGLLFVLGVAQRLGLYADFTEPAAPGLALDPWRFLALVGARLVGVDKESDDELWQDALWALLEDLARGDEESPPEAEVDAHTTAIRGWIEAHVDLPLREVLERPARIYADETRVDAVFSLAAHPIEIRLAGLDLDPGWIPAAGRALYLHFE